jgi:hypothetical protein
VRIIRTATDMRQDAGERSGEPLQADALVVFGITGDLAKKQTLRALYRLEARHRLAPR